MTPSSQLNRSTQMPASLKELTDVGASTAIAREERAAIGASEAPTSERIRPGGNSPSEEVIDWNQLERDCFYTRRGRRLFDLSLLAIFGLPALALGCAIALANLIHFRSFGKIFFVQERVGYRGQVFSIIKFRTMSEARGQNFESWGNGEDRARVTRFGRLLRNTHLDELPQLLNVVMGEMAFVGPRPEMIEIEEWAASEIDNFTSRLAVPPGVSGYAQITQGYTGNDVVAYEEKFRVSDWYRRAQCFSLDAKIILLTLVWMVRGRGWQWNRKKELDPIELPD